MKRFFLMILPLAVIGCASLKFQESQPLTARLGNYSVLQMQTTVSDPGAFDVTRTFESALMSKMNNRNLFKSYVMAGGEGGDLRLVTEIVGVTRSHDVGTSMGGAWRGSGRFTANCRLEDVKTGQLLGSFTVSGKSSAIGSGGGAGTSEALDMTVGKIVDYLDAHR